MQLPCKQFRVNDMLSRNSYKSAIHAHPDIMSTYIFSITIGCSFYENKIFRKRSVPVIGTLFLKSCVSKMQNGCNYIRRIS